MSDSTEIVYFFVPGYIICKLIICFGHNVAIYFYIVFEGYNKVEIMMQQ